MNKEPPLSGQEVDTGYSKDSKDPTKNISSQQLEEAHQHSTMKNNETMIESREHLNRITTNDPLYCDGGFRQSIEPINRKEPSSSYNFENTNNNHNIRYPQQEDSTPNNTSSSPRQTEFQPSRSSTDNNYLPSISLLSEEQPYKLPPIEILSERNINNITTTNRELVIDDDGANNNNTLANKIITNESLNTEQNVPSENQELDNNNNTEPNDDEEPTNGEASMIVWCDMCNKEVKSWRHHEKTRLHQSNLWNNNRKRRPSPPRFKFINVANSSSASPSTTNGNTTTNNITTTTIENGSTTTLSQTPHQSPPNQTNTSLLSTQNGTPQNGSTGMIISQSSSSSSSNLSSNYALGNNNGYYSSKSDLLHSSAENIDEARAQNGHKRNLSEFQSQHKNSLSPINTMKKSESSSRNTPSSSTSDSSTDMKAVSGNGKGNHGRIHSPPSRPSMNYIMNIQLTDSKTRHLFLSSSPEEQQQMFANSEKGYAFMEQLKKLRTSNEISEQISTQPGVVVNSNSHYQHAPQHLSNNNNQSHHIGSTDNLQNHSLNRQINNYSSNQYYSYQIEDRRGTPATTLSNSQYNSQSTSNYHHVNNSNRNHSMNISLNEPKNPTTDWMDMTNSNKKKQKKEAKSQLQFVDHFEQKTKKRK